MLAVSIGWQQLFSKNSFSVTVFGEALVGRAGSHAPVGETTGGRGAIVWSRIQMTSLGPMPGFEMVETAWAVVEGGGGVDP